LLSPNSQTSIKRILLVRTDRLGDVILTLPMLPALRECFPDAYIAMLLRRYTGEILEGNPYVDELLWYDNGSEPAAAYRGAGLTVNDSACGETRTAGELVPFGEMCTAIRKRRFDAAIVVYPRLRLAWLLFRSGIPLRIGTGYRFYSFLFNRKVYEHRKDAKRHEVEYNLNLLRELNCGASSNVEPDFHIAISKETEEKTWEVMESLGIAGKAFAVLHPGSGGSAREWSTENFGKLASRLASNTDVQVVVTGSKGEEVKVAEVVNASGGRALALVGKLSLKELGALIRSAQLFVSNSTGPLHLAVAMGTPVLGLYPQHTAMSVKRWGPYRGKNIVLVPDKPVDCNVCVESKTACECMGSISIEQVFESAVSLLNQKNTQGKVVHAI
jgi:heptosyltransferase-2